jgi:4-diphosphocytidyl-2-C-methyl-D-erythritol kinase
VIALRVAAPAKLNLSLAVTGRRPDGLHELDGVWALLELADELILLPGGAGLRVDAPDGEPVPVATHDNLAWRGLVEGLGGEPLDACLTLTKHVPAQAGLGGGSSDAAAAWRLGRRWSGREEAADAGTLAALSRIGADVPFFAATIPVARVSGIGERVEPVPLPPGTGAEVVLAHPPFRLATAAVFTELRREDWGSGTGNDLLAAARRLRPELDDLLALVRAAGAEPRLTGSGPTVYAIADDPERADAVATALRDRGVRSTRTRLRREPATIEVLSDPEEAAP